MKHKEFEKRFCTKIQSLCSLQGLSLEDLSAKSGISMDILGPVAQNTLTDDFLVEHIFDLARVLGCPAHELCR
ncbi:MAG: helix-turn-helix transcriptional regulator [Oscillospiraceae bacterium]|nr:helix-turn-helix transcriptional regulator [Oscillospiraceae bacterium]